MNLIQVNHYYILYPKIYICINTNAVIHLSPCGYYKSKIGLLFLTFHKLILLSTDPVTNVSIVIALIQSIDY